MTPRATANGSQGAIPGMNNCGIEKATTLSDHRDASFGQAYGVLVKELRLLARAIFVVGKDGLVKHAEVVPEMTHHPDYDRALAAAK